MKNAVESFNSRLDQLKKECVNLKKSYLKLFSQRRKTNLKSEFFMNYEILSRKQYSHQGVLKQERGKNKRPIKEIMANYSWIRTAIWTSKYMKFTSPHTYSAQRPLQ
jgi:hypothetical protein